MNRPDLKGNKIVTKRVKIIEFEEEKDPDHDRRTENKSKKEAKASKANNKAIIDFLLFSFISYNDE